MSGISLYTGPSLPPTPTDDWAGLYISGSCVLEFQAFIFRRLQMQGLGGEAWGPRAEWRKKLGGLNLVTVGWEWSETLKGVSGMVGNMR